MYQIFQLIKKNWLPFMTYKCFSRHFALCPIFTTKINWGFRISLFLTFVKKKLLLCKVEKCSEDVALGNKIVAYCIF